MNARWSFRRSLLGRLRLRAAEQLACRRMARSRQNLRRRSLLDHYTIREDHDTICEHLGKLDIVRGNQKTTSLMGQFAERFAERAILVRAERLAPVHVRAPRRHDERAAPDAANRDGEVRPMDVDDVRTNAEELQIGCG